MRFLQDHSDIHIRVLLFEQLDESPIFLIKVALDLKDCAVTKNEVRGVTPGNHKVVLALLILPVHPVLRQILSYTTFKARTKTVSLAFAVLVESSGHLLKSQDLRQTQ
jgi:hypothetical protein